MADFNKPSHTQSSDEIVNDLNSKIQALARLSLNDGTWINVPVGTVAFDPATNQFKRKTGTDTWSTIQLSLGIGSSLTVDTLSANTVTLLATAPATNQSITAASYKLLVDDVALLKSSSIDIVTGTSGTDFNISTGTSGSGEINMNTIVKSINLPSASETARGAVTTDTQTFGGLKRFATGNIQLGNSTTAANNYHITTTENSDGSIRILSGNHGTGTERLRVDSQGRVGVGVEPTNTLHIKGLLPGITLEDSTQGATGSVSLNTNASSLTVSAATLITLNSTQINTSGNINVGTTSNTYKLNVSRGASDGITAAFLRDSGTSLFIRNTTSSAFLTTDTSSNTGVELNESSDYLAARTNGSERIRITSSGAIGVGNSTPEELLDVSGGIQSRSKLLVKSTPPYVGLIDQNSATATSSAFLYADSGIFYLLRGDKGSTTWTQNSTNLWPLEVNLNTNEAKFGGNIHLTNSLGRIGIGTTAPNEKLTIQSGLSSPAGVSLRGNNNTSSTEFVVQQGGSGNAFVLNRANTDLYLGTNNITRLTIKADGQVGIGTTAPSETVQVVGNIYANTGKFITNRANADAVTTRGSIEFQIDGTSQAHIASSGSQRLSIYTGGTERIHVKNDGKIGVNTNDPLELLDVRGGNIRTTGNLFINNGSPTIYLQDSNNRSCMLHCNENTFYVLRGSGTASANWAAVNGVWPLTINLENNNAAFGGSISASGQIAGSGLTIGGSISASGQIAGSGLTISSSSPNAIISSISATDADFKGTALLLHTPNINGTKDYYFLQCYDKGTTGGPAKAFIRGDGKIAADAGYTTGADYAEFFEWLDGNATSEDRRCVAVVLDGGKIRIARTGEDPIGVVSTQPTVVGDSAWNHWKEKFLKDEYGSYITEEYEVISWIDSSNKEHSYIRDQVPANVIVPSTARITKHVQNKINPEYSPDMAYIPREQRKEWAIVGLVGKLRVRKGQVIGSRWIKLRDISPNVAEYLVR